MFWKNGSLYLMFKKYLCLVVAYSDREPVGPRYFFLHTIGHGVFHVFGYCKVVVDLWFGHTFGPHMLLSKKMNFVFEKRSCRTTLNQSIQYCRKTLLVDLDIVHCKRKLRIIHFQLDNCITKNWILTLNTTSCI